MPIVVDNGQYFGRQSLIKYLVIWDKIFEDRITRLKFYPGNPKYVVCVTTYSDKNNIREEDIVISIGNLHNKDDIKSVIEFKTKAILEICRNMPETEFIMDLDKMIVLTQNDFTNNYPCRGLNTFFTCDNNGYVNCLVNPSGILDMGMKQLTWFITYVNSTRFCLIPSGDVQTFAKQFLLGMEYVENPKILKLPEDSTIINYPLGNSGNVIWKIPGSTGRLNDLLAKAVEQRKINIQKESKGK